MVQLKSKAELLNTISTISVAKGRMLTFQTGKFQMCYYDTRGEYDLEVSQSSVNALVDVDVTNAQSISQ